MTWLCLLGGFVRWEGEHACCVFTGLVGPMSPDDNPYLSGLITCTAHVYVQLSGYQWVFTVTAARC